MKMIQLLHNNICSLLDGLSFQFGLLFAALKSTMCSEQCETNENVIVFVRVCLIFECLDPLSYNFRANLGHFIFPA